MGIRPRKFYSVHCDRCNKLFDNEEPPLRMNEMHLYTSRKRAEIGIQKAGWIVIMNHRGIPSTILCTECGKGFKIAPQNDNQKGITD